MDSLDDFKQASANKDAVLFLVQDEKMAIYGGFTTVPLYFVGNSIEKMPVNPKA